MKRIVVYAGTRNLYPAMKTAVNSLLKNNHVDRVVLLIEDDEFPFHMPGNVVTMNVSGQTYFPEDGANTANRWTYMCLMRCVLTKLLPDEHRVLWLDCDTIVDGDISELFEMDMQGNYFAGCREHIKGDYINAGVLLMDLDAIRRDDIDNVLVCVLNHQKLELPDQDAINDVAKGHILFIDSKFNVCPFTEPPEKQLIIHYAARIRFDHDPLYRKYSDEKFALRTLIAVPTYGAVDPDFMKSFIDMQNPEGTTYTIIKNSLIYNARNTIAQEAIRHGFDRVLWLDSDMMFAPDTLLKLAEDMDTGLDYVSALYFQRTFPTKPVVYSDIWYGVTNNEAFAGAKNITEYPDGLFEIAGSGFGCVLTSTLLLKTLVDRYGAPFTPMMGLGEDLAFCWRAKQNGYKMYCDSRIKCGHIGTTLYNEEVWKGQG